MNWLIYIALFGSFLAVLMSAIAIARVARWQHSVHDLDWEHVAKLTGDVAGVKRTITGLVGRMNGWDNANNAARLKNGAKHDWEQQLAEHLATTQEKPRSLGG
jgi:hypothetical protein